MHINELLKEETSLDIYHKSIFDSVECVSIGTPKHIAKLVLHGMLALNKKLHVLPHVNCKDIMQADENGELGAYITKNPNEVFTHWRNFLIC